MTAFDGLKARLERLFAEGATTDAGGTLRDAVIEMRTGIGVMRDALAQSEHQLTSEQHQRDDAVRRRDLAAGIGDGGTIEAAERFLQRQEARIGVLERKIAVQRDELDLASRELEELTEKYRAAASGLPPAGGPESIERAWRHLTAAGGSRPGVDLETELLKAEADRKLHEAAVEAQLAQLKRKLGRQP